MQTQSMCDYSNLVINWAGLLMFDKILETVAWNVLSEMLFLNLSTFMSFQAIYNRIAVIRKPPSDITE